MSIVTEVKCDGAGCAERTPPDCMRARGWLHVPAFQPAVTGPARQTERHFCAGCTLKMVARQELVP